MGGTLYAALSQILSRWKGTDSGLIGELEGYFSPFQTTNVSTLYVAGKTELWPAGSIIIPRNCVPAACNSTSDKSSQERAGSKPGGKRETVQDYLD